MSAPVCSALEQIVRVERLVPGGRGLARLGDGRAAFVTSVVPGDEIKISKAKEKKSFVEVESFELVCESEERRGADEVRKLCPVAERCGGCDWIAVSRDAQKRSKVDLVEQALRRTAGIDVSLLAESLSLREAEASLLYRSRIRLRVERGRLGFRARGSHELVEVERCAVANPAVNAMIEWLAPIVSRSPDLFSHVLHLELRAMGNQEKSLHVALKSDKRARSALVVEELRRCLRGPTDVLVRVEKERSFRQRYESVPGAGVAVVPGGFTQVNETINRMIVERVLREAQGVCAKNFLDVYCGAGNFAIPLLAQGLSGVGVEVSREAIESARESAKFFSETAEFYAERSDVFLSRLKRNGRRFDLVLVDPPRSGAKELVVNLAAITAKRLMMVSCDPVTLARDLKFLVEKGFVLSSVELYDMFPQTHHVETVAFLNPPKVS